MDRAYLEMEARYLNEEVRTMCDYMFDGNHEDHKAYQDGYDAFHEDFYEREED